MTPELQKQLYNVLISIGLGVVFLLLAVVSARYDTESERTYGRILEWMRRIALFFCFLAFFETLKYLLLAIKEIAHTIFL